MVLQSSSKQVSRKFPGCITFFFKRGYKKLLKKKFNGVSRDFQWGSRKFQWPFKQILRGFQESVKDVLRVFLGSFFQNIGTSMRRSSRPAFGRSTGNNVNGH